MNRRDIELLSTYLDGELKESDSAKLEARLKTDAQLVSVLNDLRATRTLLRKLPSRKAPRNFTLTRKMVGQNPPLPRTYPIFRFATMVATLLFFFSFGINSFRSQMSSQAVGIGIGGGNESLVQEAPAAEEPAAPAPAEPAVEEPELYADSPATETPLDAFSSQPADAVPTEDATRMMETPASKDGEPENLIEEEQVQVEQEAPRVISSAWQIGLAIVALTSALLMGLMRQVSARRWK